MATVLLVGAGEPQRTGLIAALERSGHAVIEAPDAVAAAGIVNRGIPDLMILDASTADPEAVARLADAIPGRAQALHDHEDDIDLGRPHLHVPRCSRSTIAAAQHDDTRRTG